MKNYVVLVKSAPLTFSKKMKNRVILCLPPFTLRVWCLYFFCRAPPSQLLAPSACRAMDALTWMTPTLCSATPRRRLREAYAVCATQFQRVPIYSRLKKY